jgi:hypothetical protein
VPGYLQNREASTLTRLAAARQIRPTMPEPLTEHPYLARAPGRSAGSAGRGRGLVTREFQGSADGDCLLAGFPRVRGLPGTGRRNWLVRAGWRWCSGRLTSGSADRWPEDRGVCACVRCGVPAAVHPGVAVRSRSSPVDPEPDPRRIDRLPWSRSQAVLGLPPGVGGLVAVFFAVDAEASFRANGPAESADEQ